MQTITFSHDVQASMGSLRLSTRLTRQHKRPERGGAPPNDRSGAAELARDQLGRACCEPAGRSRCDHFCPVPLAATCSAVFNFLRCPQRGHLQLRRLGMSDEQQRSCIPEKACGRQGERVLPLFPVRAASRCRGSRLH